MPAAGPPARGGGIAFLLAQLGASAADEFAVALAKHDLTPPYAGIMRLLQAQPGLSQQRLAEELGLAPSRIVAYIDDLEDRGWIERARDAGDRRVNVLTITAAGRAAFTAIAGVAREHEKRVTAGLSDTERTRLLALLTKLAQLRDLAPGVHPGYRSL
jgi:DNA-binding MarR family transcriptional regulator